MRFSALLALALLLPATPGLTQGAKDAPAAAPPLAPLTARALASHRGIYDLRLDRARENAGIVEVFGAMLYELIDACESWATRQRFSMTLRNREGTELETGSDYATLESMDGRTLRFSLTQVTQGAVSSRVAGQAEEDLADGRTASDDEQREVDHGENVAEMTEDYEQAVALKESDGEEKQRESGQRVAERNQAEGRHQKDGGGDEREIVDRVHQTR